MPVNHFSLYKLPGEHYDGPPRLDPSIKFGHFVNHTRMEGGVEYSGRYRRTCQHFEWIVNGCRPGEFYYGPSRARYCHGRGVNKGKLVARCAVCGCIWGVLNRV